VLLLAIDSSQDIGTLALGQDQELLAEHHFHHKMDLLRRITPNLEHMLSDSGRSVADLDGVVVSLGPGSFTGLRIGVTIAKTLAYTLAEPIVGVGTLHAVARGVAPTGAELICPMIHARAEEVYWSLFDSSATLRLEDYQVGAVSDVLDNVLARGVTVCFCGTGAERNRERIHHYFGSRASICESWSHFARGAALLDLGYRRLLENRVDDPSELTPLYIRRPTPVVRLESGEFEKPNRRQPNTSP